MSLAGKRVLGLVFVVGAFVAGFLAATKPDPFADTNSVWAQFDNVRGLGAIDRDIRLAGANVGSIGEVKREGDDALVEIVLDKDVAVKQDATAALRPHTLFEGSALIDLHPGSPSAPPLEDGAIIDRDHTTVYVTLDDATRILRKPVRESLRDLAGVGAKTLKGAAITGLQSTLKAAPDLTRDVGPTARALQGSHRRELTSALGGLAQTVEAVAARETQLIPLPSRAARTTAALLVDGGGPLDRAVAELPGALESLQRESPPVSELISQLDQLSIELAPALPLFSTALEDTPALIDRATPIVERGTPIIAGLRKITDRVTKAGPALTDITNGLRNPARRLKGSILPFLHKDSTLGIPTYLQLVSTFSAANGSARPYQTAAQNPNGSGHIVRLGGYVSPDSVFVEPSGSNVNSAPAGIAPSCSDVAAISARSARRLAAIGWCTG